MNSTNSSDEELLERLRRLEASELAVLLGVVETPGVAEKVLSQRLDVHLSALKRSSKGVRDALLDIWPSSRFRNWKDLRSRARDLEAVFLRNPIAALGLIDIAGHTSDAMCPKLSERLLRQHQIVQRQAPSPLAQRSGSSTQARAAELPAYLHGVTSDGRATQVFPSSEDDAAIESDISLSASADSRHLIEASGQHGLIAIDGAILLIPRAKRGWSLDEIESRFIFEERALPPELARIRQSWLDEAAAEAHKLGDAPPRIGKKWALTRAIDRMTDEIDSEPKLLLEFRITDYAALSALNRRLDTKLATGRTIRQDYELSSLTPSECPLSNAVSVSMLVFTSDGKELLLGKRTDNRGLSIYRGLWSATIEEGLNAPGDYGESDASLLGVISRGITEELGINENEIDSRTARILAVVLEADVLSYTLMGAVTIGLTGKEARARWAAGVDDKELQDVQPVDATPEALTPYLCRRLFEYPNIKLGSGEFTERWHPTARARLLLGLQHRSVDVSGPLIIIPHGTSSVSASRD